MTKSELIAFAQRNYRLAGDIVKDPAAADRKAASIHQRHDWASGEEWRYALSATAAQLRRVSERVIREGRGPTYTAERRRSDADARLITITLGCDLLDPSEAGYIPLFTSDDQ